MERAGRMVGGTCPCAPHRRTYRCYEELARVGSELETKQGLKILLVPTGSRPGHPALASGYPSQRAWRARVPTPHCVPSQKVPSRPERSLNADLAQP
jgi:hypothetical protein